MEYNGTDVLVFVQDTQVAASTNCTLNLNMDTFDVTSKDSGGKRQIKPGTSSWSVDGDFFDSVGSSNYEFTDFVTLVNARTLVSIRIDNTSLIGSTGTYYTGQGYLTSVNQTSPTEDSVTGSFTIEGTGTLTAATHT